MGPERTRTAAMTFNLSRQPVSSVRHLASKKQFDARVTILLID